VSEELGTGQKRTCMQKSPSVWDIHSFNLLTTHTAFILWMLSREIGGLDFVRLAGLTGLEGGGCPVSVVVRFQLS
jgi:hypothetical protein